jgi:hypothetical protein
VRLANDEDFKAWYTAAWLRGAAHRKREDVNTWADEKIREPRTPGNIQPPQAACGTHGANVEVPARAALQDCGASFLTAT